MSRTPRKGLSVGRDVENVPDLSCAITDAAAIGYVSFAS